MKKVYLIALVAFFSVSVNAQTPRQLRDLDSARRFLATTDLVYPYIDTAPGYPGGNEKWSSYIMSSPLLKEAIKKAKEQNMPSGKYTVVVKFAVNADGSVGEVKPTRKPVGYGLEEAAVKLVKESGKWIPANVEGKNTRSYLQLPVNFTITQSTGN